VSLSHGPTQYPDGYSIDDDNARKTLAFGNVTLEPGGSFDGSLQLHDRRQCSISCAARRARTPAPVAAPAAGPQARSTLVAVLAVRCSTPQCASDQLATLDQSSLST